MSRLLSFFLAVLVCSHSVNFGLDDLSKFSALLEHAQYHKEKYGDNFFDFLAEHYGSETHDHQHDGKSHQNLPFKHHDCSHFQTFIVENIDFGFKINPENHYGELVFFYKESASFFEKTPIFQPPKLA